MIDRQLDALLAHRAEVQIRERRARQKDAAAAPSRSSIDGGSGQPGGGFAAVYGSRFVGQLHEVDVVVQVVDVERRAHRRARRERAGVRDLVGGQRLLRQLRLRRAADRQLAADRVHDQRERRGTSGLERRRQERRERAQSPGVDDGDVRGSC